jgi:hypothetical protein
MTPESHWVSIRLPRQAAIHLTKPPAAFVDRLHHLLDLNGDGMLTAAEKAEVELLVDIAQISHLIGLGLEAGGGK